MSTPRPQDFLRLLQNIEVLRFPQKRLATFGSTEIEYNLVTHVADAPARATVRTGRITTERPRIVTPETFKRYFQGFGEESDAFERFLRDQFSESFRGLQYKFMNSVITTQPHRQDARELAQTIRKDLDHRGVDRAAVIVSPEKAWPFSLMKFVLEETSQSFAGNVRDLERRGLFDPEQGEVDRRRREIDFLFQRAGSDASLVEELSRRLKRYGLFEEYQDRFFNLVKTRGR
jgi:hypothetical protein